MKYLDLIDANDSNLLVCARGRSDIYLPYPAGTDQNTEFALYRFDDLNRTYTQADSGEARWTILKRLPFGKLRSRMRKQGSSLPCLPILPVRKITPSVPWR